MESDDEITLGDDLEEYQSEDKTASIELDKSYDDDDDEAGDDDEPIASVVQHVFIPTWLMLNNETLTHARDKALVKAVSNAWKQFNLAGANYGSRKAAFQKRLMEDTSTVSRDDGEPDLIAKRREEDPLVSETGKDGFDFLEVISTTGGMDRPLSFSRLLGPLYTQTTNLALTVYESDRNSLLDASALFGLEGTEPAHLRINLPISDQIHHETISLSAFSPDLADQIFIAIFEEPETLIVHLVMFLFDDDSNLDYIVQISRRASESEMQAGFSKPVKYVYEVPPAEIEIASAEEDSSDEFMTSDAKYRKTGGSGSKMFAGTAGRFRSDIETLRNDFEQSIKEIEGNASTQLTADLDEAQAEFNDVLARLGPDVDVTSYDYNKNARDRLIRYLSATLRYQAHVIKGYNKLIATYQASRKAAAKDIEKAATSEEEREVDDELTAEYRRMVRRLSQDISFLRNLQDHTRSSLTQLNAAASNAENEERIREVLGEPPSPAGAPASEPSSPMPDFDEAEAGGSHNNSHLRALGHLMKQWDEGEANEVASSAASLKNEIHKKWNAKRLLGLRELKIKYQKGIKLATGKEKADLAKCLRVIESMIVKLTLRPNTTLTMPISFLVAKTTPNQQTEGRYMYPSTFGSQADLKRRLSFYDQDEKRDLDRAKARLQEEYPNKGAEYRRALAAVTSDIHERWNRERIRDLQTIGAHYRNYLRVAEQEIAEMNELNFDKNAKLKQQLLKALSYREKVLEWIQNHSAEIAKIMAEFSSESSSSSTAPGSMFEDMSSGKKSSSSSSSSSRSSKEETRRRIREKLYGSKTGFRETDYGLSDFKKSPSVSSHFYETQAKRGSSSSSSKKHCVTCTTVTNDPNTFMQMHASVFSKYFTRAKNYVGRKTGLNKTAVLVNPIEKLDLVASSNGMDAEAVERLNKAAGVFKTPEENRRNDVRGQDINIKYFTIKLADSLIVNKGTGHTDEDQTAYLIKATDEGFLFLDIDLPLEKEVNLKGTEKYNIDVTLKEAQNGVFRDVNKSFLISTRRNKDTFKGVAILSKELAAFMTIVPSGSTVKLTELVFVDVKPKAKRA
jgi:hypothetical protein